MQIVMPLASAWALTLFRKATQLAAPSAPGIPLRLPLKAMMLGTALAAASSMAACISGSSFWWRSWRLSASEMLPPGPGGSISDALNRQDLHQKLEPLMHAAIDEAAASAVPNIIAFSGNRKGMPGAEGAANCVAFLNKVKAHAEAKGITICMEYLNSKVDHKDYMFDHIAWGRQKEHTS